MALTIEEVKRIASLARLRLSAEEEETFRLQLGAVVDYIDQLQTLDAATPRAAVAGVREGEDRAHDCLPRELFLANAPAVVDGFLAVPEVRGGDDG